MNKALVVVSIFLFICSRASGGIEFYYGATADMEVPGATPIGGAFSEIRKLGKADFVVRECGVEPFDDGAGRIVMYTVAVAGTFRSAPPRYPYFVTHVDGTWYVSDMKIYPVSNAPDRPKGIATISLVPGDFFFVIQVKSKTEADYLNLKFNSLKRESNSNKGKNTVPPAPGPGRPTK